MERALVIQEVSGLMGENKNPKLKVIPGSAGEPDSSDYASPYGMPRPHYVLPPAGSSRPRMSPNHPSLRVRESPAVAPGNGPYVEPDPTPPQGMVRPKRLRVIKGEKE